MVRAKLLNTHKINLPSASYYEHNVALILEPGIEISVDNTRNISYCRRAAYKAKAVLDQFEIQFRVFHDEFEIIKEREDINNEESNTDQRN